MVKSAEGKDVQLFANADQNPFMRVTELLTKKFGNMLRDKHPDVKWHIRVDTGLVSVNFKKVFELVVLPDKAPPIINCKNATVASLGLVAEDIKTDFFALLRGGPGAVDAASDDEEWTSL